MNSLFRGKTFPGTPAFTLPRSPWALRLPAPSG